MNDVSLLMELTFRPQQMNAGKWLCLYTHASESKGNGFQVARTGVVSEAAEEGEPCRA